MRVGRWRRLGWVMASLAVPLIGIGHARAAEIKSAEPTEAEEAFDRPSIGTVLGERSDGPRGKLREAGIRYRAIYTGDLLTNLSGGISRGTTYGGRVELGLEVDLEKIAGWAGATGSVNTCPPVRSTHC